MTLTYIGKEHCPNYTAEMSDIVDNKIEGASMVGGTIFFIDTAIWKIIKRDLSLGDYVPLEDFLFSVSRGTVPNSRPFEKRGRVSGITTVTTDIWDYGSTQPIYVFPTSASKMRVVSTSNDDTSNGVGARTINICGLLDGYVYDNEIITLNGQTPVETQKAWLRINEICVQTVGSSESAVGVVTVYHLTNATPIYASIPVGLTQSRQLVYTVPYGKTLYITDVRYSTGVGNSTASWKQNFITFSNLAKVNPITKEVSTIFYPFTEVAMQNMPFNVALRMPTKLPATTDLKIQCVGDTLQPVLCTALIRGWMES